MARQNVFVRTIGGAARKFRAIQEVWILPWWGSGGWANVPLWTLDCVVLVVKLCSTCAVAAFHFIIPPVMKSMYGETVLITGAGRGLGRELALQLAGLGAAVVCWDRDEPRNQAVVHEIRSRDGEAYGYTVDVSSREQVELIAGSMRRFQTDVSMVICTAEEQTYAPFLQLKPEEALRVVEVNLLAHFWIIRAFLPHMIARRHGHLVAVNCCAGLLPRADAAPHCAAMYGLRGLMDSISEELRLDTWTKSIRTTSVYLGSVTPHQAPPHRFTGCYQEVSTEEAARIIIDGIRKNKRNISIPSFMRWFIQLSNILPYRIRIIFMDFFTFSHRGWFCFC
ncbi:unnamed protein product [Plutella xylostella]|uniref:(diamondback moth) hypothetical protein n=1 Tax=Plutella xylostella TaxID=51655 RepID=A0A8S4GAB9_PLUXY|nr:unnamed protein product [Plutella xylostella]